MINLKKVTYQNIMSVGNHPITIELDRNHTTLIGGSNGTGKSTALLALVYGLYGKLLNNMRLEQAINSVNKKAMLVDVEFEKNGDEWRILRGEKPKKFEIYKNGEKLDQYAAARDQQAFLELVLGMDFKLFTQLVAINKERYIPFMEMNPADRRKIVEDVLNISVFSEMNEVLKQDVKELNRQVANKTSERSVLKTKMEGVQNLIAQLQNTIKDSKSEVEKEIGIRIETVEKTKKLIETKTEQLDELCEEQLKLVKAQLNEYSDLGQQFERNIKQYQKDYNFYKDNDNCPTCGQTISLVLKEEKRQHSEEQINVIETAIGEMMGLVEGLSEEHDELQEKVEQNVALRDEIKSLKSIVSYEEKEIQALTIKLKELESSNDQQALSTQIELYENLDKERIELESELLLLDEVATLQDQMKDLLKDDGVKSLIVKDYNSIMNRKINEYLNAMGFFINMTIDENFKETFHSMNKESFSYANLSTGQKTRLNLAITLALLEVASVKNSAVCNVMWLDELMENLDAEGVQEAMHLFKEKLFSKNIFVVTQRYEEFLDQFHSSIRFKLNNGFTELER